jgi:hypothetical protein
MKVSNIGPFHSAEEVAVCMDVPLALRNLRPFVLNVALEVSVIGLDLTGRDVLKRLVGDGPYEYSSQPCKCYS